MATLNSNYISLMAESLKKKIAVLNTIVELNEEQHEILRREPFDLDEFDRTVRDKTEQIDKLELLDDGFAALFARVKSEIDGKREEYADEIREMQGLIKTVTELSARIEAGERRNKALADNQFSVLKKEVREAKMSSQTASKYYKSMSRMDGAPQFMDQKN